MSFFKDRSDYFKSLANLNKQVAHDRIIDAVKRKSFHRMNDEEELTAACSNFAHFPCVVHFGFSGRYTGDATGVPKRKHTNSLLFLHKANAMNMDSIENAYDVAFSVMEEFISSMYYDYSTNGYCGNFDDLDLSRFSFSPYGPLNATLFGWELVFEDDRFANNVTNYDASKWFE